MRFLKWLFFVLLLCFIFGNVYVATLPSYHIYTHQGSSGENSATQIKQQIISFQNWRNLNGIDRGEVKISPQLAKNPLDSQLQVVLNNTINPVSFVIDNQIISDTLVVQHLYGFSGVKASVAQWRIRPKEVELRLQEYFSNLYKWKRVLGYGDVKTVFLQNNYKALLQWQAKYILLKKERITDSLSPQKGDIFLPNSTKPTVDIIRLPKQ